MKRKKAVKYSKTKIILLTIIIVLIAILITFFSYKMQVMMQYNVEKKDSKYIQELLNGLNNQQEVRINTKYLNLDEYLKWQDIKIRNDFENMEIRPMQGNQILYEVKSEEQSQSKSFYISKGSTYLEELEEYIKNGWSTVKIKDLKEFCLENEIYDDIDLINYVSKNYYAENHLFTNTKKMKENYIINLFVTNYLYPVKKTTILNGSYKGYMFEKDNYYEIHLLHNNTKYTFVFVGEEYKSENYILDIISTIEIN
jgi:hypothetical protein